MEYIEFIQMYSPISHPTHSPFTSLRTSQTNISTYSHTRTLSNAKTPSTASNQVEPHRVPSHKKLSLTFQAQQCRPHKQEGSPKKHTIPTVQPNNRGISMQDGHNEQFGYASQQQLMVHFQQLLENLKREYLLSVRGYEGRIDDLQQQLHRNAIQIQEKNVVISKLEASVKESRRERQKEAQVEGQIHGKIEDLQKRLSLLAEFAEESRIEMHQNTECLAEAVIRCFGTRLAVLRDQQATFIKKALEKLTAVEARLQAKEKQEPSVGTRGSMESVEEPPLPLTNRKPQDQSISFWDDCFFYPGEHSQNCALLVEMYERRQQALNCWVDRQGLLHYCDSGSFLYNRKGERVSVAYNELEWLREQGMLRIY